MSPADAAADAGPPPPTAAPADAAADRDVQPLVDEAGRALEAGDYGRVLSLLAPVVARPPGREPLARVLSLLARASFRLGEYDDAVRHSHDLLLAIDAGVQMALAPRFSVLGVAAVACALIDRFEDAVGHAIAVQGVGKRLEAPEYRLRAHGTAATVIILLGDPWAGARMLDGLVPAVRQAGGGRELEAAAQRNRAGCALILARLARDAGDPAARDAALRQAEAALAEEAALVARSDARAADFVAEHRADLALLRGDVAGCHRVLDETASAGGAPPVPGRLRALQLLRVEARLLAGDAHGACALADAMVPSLRAGHEVAYRLRLAALRADALAAAGRHEAAAEARRAHQRAVAAHHFAQTAALSRTARQRLELEHVWTRAHAPAAPPPA